MNVLFLRFLEDIIVKYIAKLQDHAEQTRLGYSLAIGAFPKPFLAGKLNMVLGGLMRASRIEDKHVKFAESRRDAIKSLARYTGFQLLNLMIFVGKLRSAGSDNAPPPSLPLTHSIPPLFCLFSCHVYWNDALAIKK